MHAKFNFFFSKVTVWSGRGQVAAAWERKEKEEKENGKKKETGKKGKRGRGKGISGKGSSGKFWEGKGAVSCSTMGNSEELF